MTEERGGPPTGSVAPEEREALTDRLLRGAESLPGRALTGVRAALRYAPTRRLALAAALAAPLWLVSGSAVGAWVASAATALLALAAAADILRAPGARDLLVERELPGEVGLGDAASGSYHVRSLWHRLTLQRAERLH